MPAAVKTLPKVSLDDLPDRYSAKFVPPNLANATVTSLIDIVGSLRAWKNYIEAAEKFYMTALKARNKTGAGEGDSFQYSTEKFSQERISAELAREKLTEDQVASITATIDMSQSRFGPRLPVEVVPPTIQPTKGST